MFDNECSSESEGISSTGKQRWKTLLVLCTFRYSTNNYSSSMLDRTRLVAFSSLAVVHREMILSLAEYETGTYYRPKTEVHVVAGHIIARPCHRRIQHYVVPFVSLPPEKQLLLSPTVPRSSRRVPRTAPPPTVPRSSRRAQNPKREPSHAA